MKYLASCFQLSYYPSSQLKSLNYNFSNKITELHNKIKGVPFYFIGYISLQTIKS